MFTSEESREDYIGNGTTRIYSYSYRIVNEAHLRVIVADLDNVETVLILNTDYVVRDVGKKGGGTIALTSNGQAWLNGTGDLITNYKLVIKRVVPLTQELDIRNNGDFFPEVHEDAFDYARQVDIAQQEEVDRSMKLQETADVSSFNPTIPSAALEPNTILKVNSAGSGFEAGPTSEAIEGAEAQAQAAEASALAAAASAVTSADEATDSTAQAASAQTSALAAAASAADSQAAAAASIWSDVVFVTVADSPVVLSQTDAGKLYVADTTTGDVVFNLPDQSAVARPFNIGFKKSDPSANEIRVAAGSFGGLQQNVDDISTTVFPLTQEGFGAVFIADADVGPNGGYATLPFASSFGAGSVSKIAGSGGQIVTDTNEMIGGSTGMVANAGNFQVKNALGNQAYMQFISGQFRLSGIMSQLRWPLFQGAIFNGGSNATNFSTRANMSTAGQTLGVPGNSYQGYLLYIYKEAGFPFKIEGTFGGNIIGYPNGISMQNDGDAVLLHQVSATNYVVVASDIKPVDPRKIELWNNQVELGTESFTFISATGNSNGSSPGPNQVDSMSLNSTNPLSGSSDLLLVTKDYNFYPFNDTSFSRIEIPFTLSEASQVNGLIRVEFDMIIDSYYERAGAGSQADYQIEARLFDSTNAQLETQNIIQKVIIADGGGVYTDPDKGVPMRVELDFFGIPTETSYKLQILARSQSFNGADS